VGPRAGLDVCEKSLPHRDSIPRSPSPQPVAIPTELSRPLNSLSTRLKFLVADGTTLCNSIQSFTFSEAVNWIPASHIRTDVNWLLGPGIYTTAGIYVLSI
jgi:hypothetical protein